MLARPASGCGKMPRPRNASPARKLHVAIPGDIWPRLDLHLFSEAEQRIPFAAHQRFLVDRIREFFNRGSISLAAFFPDAPPDLTVYGDRAAIEFLANALKEQ